ncbi:MAG: DNA replication and repair protein RecF [Bacteroidetes bacterium]|nr:MAG: DNA replication and repair protein RecF [Bacteroidota bacterium]
MLYIKNVRFQQFKNYEQAQINLCEQVNCFVGKNGAGKTNVLDAIYYLSFTKSFFNTLDYQNIKHGKDYFSLQANYVKNSLEEHALLSYLKGKKTLKINNNDVKKFAEHIGDYPLVMIAPNDLLLLHEGSAERRKFMDGIIAQTDKFYLNDLLAYNRILEQRNKQLKLFAENNYLDDTLLDTYNKQLTDYGNKVHQKRLAFLQQFIPVFTQYYEKISTSQEQVSIAYESDLANNDLRTLLNQYLSSDIAAQRTNKGIHKDELDFKINNFAVKKFGSQGQQKSFIIALKLAQYEYLKQHNNIKPLLLLDDIFEKLDQQRLNTLLQMIAQEEFGQIFITDTHLNRLKEVFEGMPAVAINYYLVEQGNISKI